GAITATFLLLFYFPVPSVGNTAIFLFGLYAFLSAFNIKFRKALGDILNEKYVLRILFGYVFVIVLGFLYVLGHGTYEFSILRANFLTLFIVATGFLLYTFINKDVDLKDRERLILKLFIIVFLIQSIIQTAAFIFPAVKSFVNTFQKEDVAEKDYGGIRALALTGNPFFALASGYGLVFIFFIRYIIISKEYFSLKNSLYFILLFVGSFYAGRTAFIGVLFAIFYLVLSQGKRFRKIYEFLKLLCLTGVFTTLIYLFFLPTAVRDIVDNKLLPFAFELYYNYNETGSFSTSSTDALKEMYFPVRYETFLFGDAMFVDINGSYYMHTDAGYMRYLLFYGVFGSIFILLYTYFLYFKIPMGLITRNIRKKNGERFTDDLFFFLLVFAYLLTLHYKGVALLGTPLVQVMVIWVGISYVQSLKHVEDSSFRNIS